ncbi:MAG TPA: MerR family transcriptional regulator [Ktedonosporobacter sp.]|nr:MerR family transcriptional regulator [Ktedonosporobacter sp.]
MKRRLMRSRPLTDAEAIRLPKYTIGIASKLVGLPPQMLRRYEEAGLLEPARQEGKNRLYSDQDVADLEEMATLSAEGINAAGIRRILQMRRQIHLLQEEIKAAQQGKEGGKEGSPAEKQHEDGTTRSASDDQRESE